MVMWNSKMLTITGASSVKARAVFPIQQQREAADDLDGESGGEVVRLGHRAQELPSERWNWPCGNEVQKAIQPKHGEHQSQEQPRNG